MRKWQLSGGDPLVLTLAADARLGGATYTNDQIWELALGGGDPPALALHTTFGLRARAFRMFPIFRDEEKEICDPAAFARPVVVHQFFPNMLELSYAPLSGLDVGMQLWVPASQVIAGRLTLANNGRFPLNFRLFWVALLTPNDGERMVAVELEGAPAIGGQTDGLAPVVFITGGAQALNSPYPALALDISLPVGGQRQLTWCQASLEEQVASFNIARATVARPWDAELARIELFNAAQVEVQSGDPAWDAALALSQKQALALLAGPGDGLPQLSFLLKRGVDQGYSLRGDGSDYTHLWNGQTALEAYYLAGILLPGYAEIAKGLVRNFLAVQEEDGFIDWKPGLGGQRGRLLATPVLAALAWRIYEASGDTDFLADVFPGLLAFVQRWFSPQQDRDGDGIPEWDHPSQAGYEDHPLFSRWHAGTQGLDITTVESPVLCACLYRECQSLLSMARILQRPQVMPALETWVEGLRSALELGWDDQGAYRYWDRDSHQTPTSALLAEQSGPGMVSVEREFSPPARVLVEISTAAERPGHPDIFVRGLSASGQNRLEHLEEGAFKWNSGLGCATGSQTYSQIETIDISGLEPADRVTIRQVGLDALDLTLLLPLWAGMPSPQQAAKLVERLVTNPQGFWGRFGLSAQPAPDEKQAGDRGREVRLLWNVLIAEGLLAYGYRRQAAELVDRLMAGITHNLAAERAFRSAFDAVDGQGRGERNILHGFAPVGLFLDALGVRFLSPHKVRLESRNFFPWPVEVKYRGTKVRCTAHRKVVTFANGQSVTFSGKTPKMVSLEPAATPPGD